jgi:hypothetical protein
MQEEDEDLPKTWLPRPEEEEEEEVEIHQHDMATGSDEPFK